MLSSILSAIIVFVAAFVRAVSGFGYSLVATPLLTFVYDAKSAVLMSLILGSATHLMVLLQTHQHIDWKRLGLISIGCLFGVPLGAFSLARLDNTIIKLAIAILVVPFSALMLFGHSHKFKKDSTGCCTCGFVSGVIGASTSLAGPPVVLFLLNQGIIKETFVGTLAAFFLFNNILSIGAFTGLGMIGTDLLIKVGILFVPMVVGTFLGIKLLPKVNPTLFKRLALIVVSASALIIVINVVVAYVSH